MTTENKQDATDNSELQAKAQYESIADMVAAYEFAQEHENKDLTDEDELAALDDDEREEFDRLVKETDFDADELTDPDKIRERIEQDPLSIEVRSGWHTPGDEDGDKASEFNILLCTGGPAVRIMGELNEHCEPDRAWIEHQDWFKPWTQYFGADQETLLKYCRVFWFGE